MVDLAKELGFVTGDALCYINGRRYDLPPGRAEVTLLTFLREKGLTGTKLGCGEGGCGACTVMVSHWEGGGIEHRAVNACLCPLYAVDGMHVVTVEGIGNVRDGLHPVQRALSSGHGSQCGFCTPGFVMSMYALLRAKTEAPPTEEEMEDALGGNLCRCTGYRPILDAFRDFCSADPKAYTEEAIAASKGLVYGAANGHANGHANGDGKVAVCPSTGMPCDCKAAGNGCGGGGACDGGGACGKGGCGGGGKAKAAAVAAAGKPTVEPIFPAALKRRTPCALHMPGAVASWWRPTTLDQALALRAAYPDSRLVGGNTEVGIEMKFKHMRYPVLITPTLVPEMNQITVTPTHIEVGSAVTLTRMADAFKGVIALRPAHETATLRAVVGQLRWFAGPQIRNVSALGGNIVTGSPISDLNPLWMASRTEFVAVSADGGERTVPANQFFLGYRQVDLKEGELLLRVRVPFTRRHEYVREFKQSPRREDDIAIVNAGMRVQLAPAASGQGWEVAEAEFAFGGVAAKALMAPAAAAALLGRPWTQATLAAALEALKTDVVIADNAPGGRPEYRRALTASFLFKFFASTSLMLEAETAPGSEAVEDAAAAAGGGLGGSDAVPAFAADLPAAERDAGVGYERPPARGVQFFAKPTDPDAIVGQPERHLAADLQVTGEATYVDDIKHTSDLLYAALVPSSRPHARLLRVDAEQALGMPGVQGFFSAKDVPGSNVIGPTFKDEEVFASEFVTAVGQPIGLVVADTEANARAAARAVMVEYEDLPAAMSCEEAIEQQAFHSYYHGKVFTKGDVESCLSAECDHVLEGEFKVGGQEHFYLETNASTVIPQENDEFLCVSSTQAVAKHHKELANVLGVPAHKIVSKTKRLGGGFGGKETRAIWLHVAIAVPAYHLRRPVKIMLDRDEDMQMTGQRHAFLAKYKVGFSRDGMVKAVDMRLFSAAGNSMDLSGPVMDRAILHSDNCYTVPHMRLVGKLCKTNQSSNTAYRGFGGPQGLIFAEMWMERVARTVGRPVHELKALQLQGDGWVTVAGQTMEECRIKTCWDAVYAKSDFDARFASIGAWNKEHRWRKRGLAIVPTKFGISFTALFMNQAGALVHVYLDGTVLVTHGGVEMGQGLHTKMCQVVAQALKVPLASVFISETSTNTVPNASPTAASASSDMYGAALLHACEQLNARLAPFRQAQPSATFKEVVNAAYFQRVDLCAHGFYKTPDITGESGNRPFNYYTYGCAVSEVELDVLTGDFQLLRTDIAMDVGNPINPAIDIGQVEGAFVQGMGWTCLEELQWGDKQHPWVRPGHLFTKGPGTYKIPSVNDIPIDFRVELLSNVPNSRAIHSSKAIGEPPFFLGSSVFFALKEACYAAREDAGLGAAWFRLDAPATPERLRMACGDKLAGVAADFRAKISC
uniref:xanthine dehydrogenase n=1 Tax=Chlamydomonas euryale TaxID=1486919 RepID=A0A7R9YWD4_9CHLO|mmetsp:Transcript_30769/g.91408  ORF Transcript_30769/g.91408 Transcript_30769/m.91408 type:complete len:1410 (+) Transcript_30769:126-4355(+)